jgi:aminocarboxymuconate-semialdehyde decarboxylase
MKIDIYPHFLPSKYKEAVLKKANRYFYTAWFDKVFEGTPALYDLDVRLRLIERYEGLRQVLTVSSPAVEEITDPKTAIFLSKLANDEMAELVSKYPDKFIAAVACLPMNDVDAALEETDRAIRDLKLKGIQIYTPINGKPLDSPEFMPLYEKMAEYDLPIWIHPTKSPEIPDYINEDYSKYGVFQMFAWPFETTLAMTRLVFSGVLEKYPRIKFIIHHGGAMVPFFAQRIILAQDYNKAHLKLNYRQALKKNPIEYYRMFYADTAVSGSTPALMCGYAFFGAERILFGTDVPYDSEEGNVFTKVTIESIEHMNVPKHEKDMIFEDNARRLLHLTS